MKTALLRKIIPLLALLIVVTPFFSYSQKIDSVMHNGSIHYVYPYKIAVKSNQAYFNSLVLSKKHISTIVQMLKNDLWKNLSPEEYEKALKLFNKQIKNYKRLLKKERGQQSYHLAKAISENPYPILEQIYERDVDIQPCLDNIPDGKYVQYFYDFALISPKNELMLIQKKVAGVFEIKNNVLNGKGAWFNFKGDTLKKGIFKNGLKEGEWYFETRRVENRLSKELIQAYIQNGTPEVDTIVEKMLYRKGVRNGFYTQKGNAKFPFYEGHYSINDYAGHWVERLMYFSNHTIGDEAKKAELIRLKNNSIITAEYTFAKDPITVKQPIIRGDLIMDEYDENFNFDSEYSPYNISKDLFSIAFEEELDLELEEEKSNSYEGEEYNEDYYEEESDYQYDGENESDIDLEYTVYDTKREKYISRAKAIDSIGLKFNFEGIYERHYSNGQLMFRYEFKNGKLLKEDTLFWDNGKPYDVVLFNKDSNQYIHSIYDYDGKLFNEIVYDHKGAFVRYNFRPNYVKYHTIEGLLAKETPNSFFISYDKMDTLKFPIQTDSLLIWKSWNLEDSTKLFERTYFPKDRILKFNNFSMTGKSTFKGELQFSEDFKSWTGIETTEFKNLTLKSHKSASFNQYYFGENHKDTLLQANVNLYDQAFNVTTDNVLLENNVPFTGSFSLVFNTKKPSFKIGSSIHFSLPIAANYSKKLEKDYLHYKKTGKLKYPDYLNTIDRSEIYDDHSYLIFNSLFPFISELITYPEVYHDDEDLGNSVDYNEKDEEASAKTIEGKFVNGKPQGIWIVKDQFGKIHMEVPFLNGEINGVLKKYEYAEKAYLEEEFEEEYGSSIKDTFPTKETHYLYSIENYKNGMLHGEAIRYNWLGNEEARDYYVDGLKQGKSFERNHFAITKMNYQDDAIDGYMQTYLTLKGKDSILLYNLNFQNGLLQGESKSFHTNGKLAKRGFFLNGQSIDDYEAFDTLGFKYHYVKFLYSFPIEEKIWEENELSVRYTFDWRDSIYFTPSDITSTESLSEMLANLNIGSTESEYYGRPSLVDKTGINYRMTKYYPNDTIARDGEIAAGKKVGCWKYYNYEGQLLNEVDYQDSIIKLNDSIQFKSKGVIVDYNVKGKPIRKSFIIEKFEKYDCSHTDHYEIRQLYTTWEANDTLKLKNGYVKNHYDNGVLQNEGKMENGLPTGIWKFYDPFGKLNQVGIYVMGKRDGRWLSGDLSKTKYLGDICLNPDLPDIEDEIKKRESMLDIVVTNYHLGKALNKEFFDINWAEIEKKEQK